MAAQSEGDATLLGTSVRELLPGKKFRIPLSFLSSLSRNSSRLLPLGLLWGWCHAEMETLTDSNLPRPRVCGHCKAREARKGQSDCHQCHNLAMRGYRARQKNEAAHLRGVVDQLTRNNTATRNKFEQAVGTRWVIVSSKEGDAFADFAGYVTGFCPLNSSRF